MAYSHRRLKQKVYKRDGLICQLRIHPDCPVDLGPLYRKYLAGQCTRKRALLTIDHRVPVSKGGRWELANLQVACAHCNRMKGSLSPAAVEELLTDN